MPKQQITTNKRYEHVNFENNFAKHKKSETLKFFRMPLHANFEHEFLV